MRDEGRRLNERIQRIVQTVDQEPLGQAALHYPKAGGKGLRPAIGLLACEAAGGDAHQAEPLALAVELVHTFSLVHDDLMDRDELRRGEETVHVAYDEPTAILAGDVLFALAFETLTDLHEDVDGLEIVGHVARTARRLCEGQQLDMIFEDEWPSVGTYESMISKKTAALFACVTRNAAMAGDDDRTVVTALGSFGHAIGMGFQIQDDLLDLVGDVDAMGKPIGSDIRAGKKTHPIIEAHERGSSEEQEVLEDILANEPDDEDVEWVLDLVERSGALEASQERARGFFEAARSRLQGIPASEARDELLQVVDWIEQRDH